MAPEQALGHIDDIDARTDVYAVGATMFMALTGQHIHAADNGNQMLLAAMTRPARALREVAPEIPHELQRVVDRALAFERDARWPSARDMQLALRALGPHVLATSVPRLPVAAASGPVHALTPAPVVHASVTGGPRGATPQRPAWGLYLAVFGIGTALVAASVVLISALVHPLPTAASTEAPRTSATVSATALPSVAPPPLLASASEAPVVVVAPPSSKPRSNPPARASSLPSVPVASSVPPASSTPTTDMHDSRH